MPSNVGALYYGLDFPYYAKNNLIYNRCEIFPLKSILFEGNMYKVPQDTISYLENLYGDYNHFPEYIPVANPHYFEQMKKSLQVH